MRHIFFLLPYPLHRAPSQRFRVEAFFKLLRKKEIDFRLHTFLDEDAWNVLYKNGSAPQKVMAVLKGFLKRLWIVLFVAPRYKYIFIHREAAPLGPPLFEWILAKVFRKRLIFDFDDAIWMPKVSEANKVARMVKCFWKIPLICQWSYKISAGNAYLAAYARQKNKRVTIVPTCVDTDYRFNRIKKASSQKVVIGWTGSYSTLPYLDLIYPVLQRLEQTFAFEFLVICNQKPAFFLSSLRFRAWHEQSEIDDLLQMDIGVMPLVDDAWSEGKCGFKIIQYLSLGIPAVASPVGVNKEIIQEGVHGALCMQEEDWYNALVLLMQNEPLRRQMGVSGRDRVVKQYSIAANWGNFLSLFS